MDQGWAVVLGMSLAYVASFLGMAFAYLSYRRRKKESKERHEER